MISMLANHLWQSTLFAIAIASLAWLLRDHRAQVRYALWLIASLKFLIPFSMLTALGGWLSPDAVTVTRVAGWSASMERFAEPVAAPGFPAALAFALLAVWACGFGIVLAFRASSVLRIRAIVRTASETGEPVGGSRPIPLKYSATQLEPALVGIFRPVLLLPQGVEERLTAEQLRAVVAHELCHASRRDNLTAAMHMVAEAVFWFHPLVWWIGGRLVEERERACDEAVVSSGHDREAYAEAILDMCELYVASSVACASGVGVGGTALKERITSIMRRQAMVKLHPVKKLLLASSAVCTIAVPVAVGWLSAGSVASAQEEEFLPIVKVAPVYPEAAFLSSLEGYVIIEFTVTEQGTVENPIVIDASSTLFEESALNAARKFKYKPRTINGQPVPVHYVRNKFTYLLDGESAEPRG